MTIAIGTSGFSYAEWKGRFYPKDLKADHMLAFYARAMKTVEINNTFYRAPTAAALATWAAKTPADFSFVLKAPRFIAPSKKPITGKKIADGPT